MEKSGNSVGFPSEVGGWFSGTRLVRFRGMNVYAVNTTATSIWHATTERPHCPRVSALKGCCVNARETRALGLHDRLAVTSPIELIVPDADLRCIPREFRYHVYGGSFPRGAFCDFGDGLFIASPELSLVQHASSLSVAGVLLLALEMCGSYRLTADDGFATGCEALTSAARLRRFVSAAKGMPGQPRAMRAMRYVVDGSASPMESAVLVRLCLPLKHGGYACPLPVMNGLLQLTEALQDLSGRGYLLGDLLWPDEGLLLEYNGEEWHTGRQRITRDALRANAIALSGVKALSLTADIYNDPQAFHAVARRVLREVGTRYRKPTQGQLAKRLNLPQELREQERLIRC